MKAELAEYLGGHFERRLLTGDDALVVKDLKKYKSVLDFYKRNRIYLYHLTAFNCGEWKMPYRAFVREVAPAPRLGLDYGCGIGADGLVLMDDYGYQFNFADYKSKCTEYLQWRLDRRGSDARVYDIEKDSIPRHELVITFSVVEHIPTKEQPLFLEQLARLGDIVIVSLADIRSIYDGTGIHYPVDVSGLLGYIKSEFGIISHKIVNHYVNLVAYHGISDYEEVTNVSNGSHSL